MTGSWLGCIIYVGKGIWGYTEISICEHPIPTNTQKGDPDLQQETLKTEELKPEPKVLVHRPVSMVLAAHLFRFAVKLFFRIYGRGRVSGLENIPREGALIVAPNHASDLDPILGWAFIGAVRPLWGIAKVEIWDKPVGAYMMGFMGGVPVKRGTADRTMLRFVLDRLNQGEVIGVFPEGTRSRDGKLQVPQAGVGLLVQKTGARVIPVGFSGTFAMLPPGAKKLKPARLTMRVGKPMTFPQETSREEIARQVMEAIAQLVEPEPA